jgi:hypothetical protein
VIARDAPIPDATELYRRVHVTQIVWDDNAKRLRPNNSVFKDVELSIHLGDVLEDEGRSPESVLDDKPSHHLVAFTAGLVTKDEEQTVGRDPQEADESHGLVTGPKPKPRRGRLALAARWEALRRDGLTPELQADLDGLRSNQRRPEDAHGDGS